MNYVTESFTTMSSLPQNFEQPFYDLLNTNYTLVPKTDLDVGRFINRACRTDEHYISYRPTGKSGQWYEWDGIVHRVSPHELDEVLVTSFLDALKRYAHNLKTQNAELASTLNVRADNWSKNTAINGLKARVRASLRVPTDHFDNVPNHIVMSDGRVLFLGYLDGTPLDPDPARPVTRHLGVSLPVGMDVAAYMAGDASERAQHAPRGWLKWLEQMIPNDEERLFLQTTAGAAFVGDGTAKNIVHFVGAKDTGKSFYVNVISNVFGDYSGHLKADALVDKPNNYAQSDAKGVRFLTLSEPSTRRVDDSFLKSISGSRDPIRTRNIYEASEEWYAECVLHIAANSVVNFKTQDPAIVDRINIIEMTKVLSPHEINPSLEMELLDDEGAGMLLWIMEGAERYMTEGVTVPESVKARALDNVVDSSSALRWQAERVAEGRYVIDTTCPASAFVERADAFADYREWCTAQNETPMPNIMWRTEIHQHNGLPRSANEPKSKGTMRVFGLRTPALSLPSEGKKGKSTTLKDLGWEDAGQA